MDEFVYIFGYGGGQGSPIKVTTMRAFSNIESIIELLLKEFSRSNYRVRIHNANETTDFEMFMSRWHSPPKVYVAKLNDEEHIPKLIRPLAWREHLKDFSKNHPEKIAKLLLSGEIEL